MGAVREMFPPERLSKPKRRPTLKEIAMDLEFQAQMARRAHQYLGDTPFHPKWRAPVGAGLISLICAVVMLQPLINLGYYWWFFSPDWGVTSEQVPNLIFGVLFYVLVSCLPVIVLTQWLDGLDRANLQTHWDRWKALNDRHAIEQMQDRIERLYGWEED